MVIKKFQVAIIFQLVVMRAREAFSKLNVLPNFSPVSFPDLFHVTNDGFTS